MNFKTFQNWEKKNRIIELYIYIYIYKIEILFLLNLSVYVCECVKFSHGDLNSGSCPPHLTSIYTRWVTIAPRLCGGIEFCFNVAALQES